MYIPEHFAETDVMTIRELVRTRPLGTLITTDQKGLVADHIPFLFDDDGTENGRLIGHVARSNALWHEHSAETDVLVIFQGPSAYITPNWYQTKQETHEVVPTYNYAVAHFYGPLIVHDDPKWVRGIVGRLTKAFEANEPTPWKMADSPRDFMDDQLTRIVGIEIPVRSIVGKWKASQNRSDTDRSSVVDGLANRACNQDLEMAEVVMKRLVPSGEDRGSAQ